MPVPRSATEEVPAWEEVITRVFDAPLELVFDVWTKVEHFERWFGPLGVEVVDCELEPRPGGIIRFGHRFPDGPIFRVKGNFHEVVEDARLVFTLGFVDEHGRPRRHPMFADWPLEAVLWTTVVFAEVDRGTRVTVTQRVTPPEVVSHPSVMRNQELALEGWRQVLSRLGDHLSMHHDPRGDRA
jgi:uncharacterized protein YndB with AHSA1/START domain